jgi:hypothetical protein
VWVCGCEIRPVVFSSSLQSTQRWFLCSYHEGFDDALDEADA